MSFHKIGVIGAGAWGTALAITANRAGRDVHVWARQPQTVQDLNKGENPDRLPGLCFPPLQASTDLADLAQCDAILWVCPTQPSRDLMRQFAAHARPGLPIALCSKGMEKGSQKFMSQILHEMLPHTRPAVLSGPSFAEDLARGLPAAVTLACADEDEGMRWIQTLGHAQFRPYLSHDIIGAQIGGVLKNVLAIACGIATGLELGDSGRAALIARGFTEMTRFGTALGADPTSLSGLCGLGDLLLTCTSEQSRNMRFGMAVGRGRDIAEILETSTAVIEGVFSAKAVSELAMRKHINMPVCNAVAAVLAEQTSVANAIDELMNRPFTSEASKNPSL